MHQQPRLVDCVGVDRCSRIHLAVAEGDEQPVVEQPRALHVAAGEGQGEQHAIGTAMAQRLAGLAAGFLAQIELEVGILLAEPRQDARQQEGRDGGDDAHPHLARERTTGGAGEVAQLVRLAQHAAGLLHDPLAQRREADHPAGALDQHHADQRLQLADAGGERRLGDEAGLGGAAEMSGIVKRHQILQLFEGREVGLRH